MHRFLHPTDSRCSGRAHAVFAAAAGVIGLHVLDDSFLQPQPGTSAADHLAGGLVPLAVLLLAAWAFPRLSGLLRGATSILLGVLGAVTGVEAMYYLREVGASGDDYSGLLAVPAGLTLVGLGVVTLWRTRRTTGGVARRLGRRALLLVAAFLIFQFVAWPVGYAYITTHVARPWVAEPVLGADFETVSFTTSDGLELQGWYVPSRNGAAVISFPGRKEQRQARLLAEHGYGVLLFDRRGEGESEGDPNSWGWGGHRDLDAAVAFLQARPDVEPGRIGAIGRSVGGEMLLEAAADNDGIAAVVTEGAGARMASEAISDLEGFEQAQGRLFYGLMFAGVSLFSNQAPPQDLEQLIPDIEQPILFIAAEHGEVGDKTPEYLAAARGAAEAWIVPEGGHTGAIGAMPEEYERRVIGFLDRELAR